MLRNLIIVSTSGLLLFSKIFQVKSGSKQDQFLGGIVIAMLKQSVFKTGLPVSFIELSKVGVAIVSNPKVACALFVDINDGMEFAKLLARELLDTFTQTYVSELEEKLNSPDTFSSFNSKIGEVINTSVRPVLDNLQDARGIKLALLVSGDSLKHATQEVDKLSVLANHQALLQVANDIMTAKDDAPTSITMRGKATTLILQRIERQTMLVIYKNSAEEHLCLAAIDKSSKLLKSILHVASNLQDSR
jgi:predicted regulator of Ras-like GTPase activity (Roadblock/LC7/MglB family)